VELVEFLAGTEHDVEIRDMHDPVVASVAAGYGIRRVPAGVIDGRLADCHAELGLDEETLTRAIVGPARGAGPPARAGASPRRWSRRTRRRRTGKPPGAKS